MSVEGLSRAIKAAIDMRIEQEARAMRGVIQNGQFQSGAKSYPYVSAVDANTSEGKKVWAQLSQSGKAVVVGE